MENRTATAVGLHNQPDEITLTEMKIKGADLKAGRQALGMSAAELERLATARYGVHWASKLARDMELSIPAVSRWRKEGLRSGSRAAQVRGLLVDGALPPPKHRRDGIAPPSPAEFADWLAKNFRSLSHASAAIGLDKDTLSAMRDGVTRNDNPHKLRLWVRYMMTGYNMKTDVAEAAVGVPVTTVDGAIKRGKLRRADHQKRRRKTRNAGFARKSRRSKPRGGQ